MINVPQKACFKKYRELWAGFSQGTYFTLSRGYILLKFRGKSHVKQTWIDLGQSRTLKTDMISLGRQLYKTKKWLHFYSKSYDRDNLRFRASPRHSGQGFFFEFLFFWIICPVRRGGAPLRAAAFIVPDEYRDTISLSPLNTVIFMGNNLFFTNLLRGFTTITVSASKMRHPWNGNASAEQVLDPHHTHRRGSEWGRGTVPLFQQVLDVISYSHKKESTRSENGTFKKKSEWNSFVMLPGIKSRPTIG